MINLTLFYVTLYSINMSSFFTRVPVVLPFTPTNLLNHNHFPSALLKVTATLILSIFKVKVKVSFIVNSATCTVHTYRELKLRYSLTPWCIQITLNTNSRTQKYRYKSNIYIRIYNTYSIYLTDNKLLHLILFCFTL